jgi:hypothetical protein
VADVVEQDDGTSSPPLYISYAPDDAGWAEWIAWELDAAGYRVRLDRWERSAGDNAIQRIDAALRGSRVIALLSAAYYEPLRDVVLEWTAVFASGERLIPLRVDDTEPPPLFRALVTPSLVGLDPQEARRVLLRAVAPPRRPHRPPPFPRRPDGAGDAPSRQSGQAPRAEATPPRDTEPGGTAPPPGWSRGAALLTAVHTYQSQPDVPSAAQSLAALREVLLSPRVGLPAAAIRVLDNPTDPREILDALDATIDRAALGDGTLFFFYVGHGAVSPVSGRLLLSTADSRPHTPHSYLDFAQIRDQIAYSAVSRRLVVLDCCFSGAALDALAGPVPAVIEGSYVMASSAATEVSRAGDRFTAFTGALLEVLADGLPNGPAILDAEALFQGARQICLARGWPVPQRQVRSSGDRIPITTNPWRRAERRPPTDLPEERRHARP